jgi:hypothetical protein
MFLFTFVSADSIGDNYKVDEQMQITNYCQAGTCTYMNLSSIEYPNGTVSYLNSIMTQNGQTFNSSFTPDQVGEFYFVTCGDSSVAVCDKDEFTVTYNGESNNDVAIYIVLLIFMCSLIFGYFKLRQKVDFDKWYKNILKKYEDRNFIKSNFSFVFYSLAKDSMLIYYSLVFIVIMLLSDIIFMFNVISLIPIIEKIVMLYSLGIIAVAFLFIGKGQELIRDLIDNIKDENWGMGE